MLEDQMLREKITAFDHERIHGRVVHAHGAAAHGVPEVYQSMSHLTGFHRQTIAKGKIAILAVYGVLGPAPGESRPGGVCVSTDASALSRSFIADIFVHRHWARANEDSVAA